MQAPQQESHDRLFVIGAFALALACRVLAFLPVLLTPVASVPIGYVDSLYHLRRVELILLGGHLTPPFDLYSAFPTGGDFFWPPLFDYLLASITWLVTLGDPTRASIQWVSGIVAAIVGALIVWPTYAIGRRVAGQVGGRIAAVVIATVPIHVIYTAVGRADHHGAETLLLVAYFAGFLGTMSACEKRVVLFRNAGRTLPWRRVILAGLAGFALISVQMGAVLLAGVIPVFLALRFLNGVRRSEDCQPLLVAGFAIQAIATLLLAIGTTIWGGPRRFEFVYNQPSLFQPMLMALFTLFALFLHAAHRTLHRAPTVVSIPTTLLASTALFLVLPLAALSEFRAAVGSATGWVTSQEVYLTRVLETRSLLWRDGAFTLVPAWGYLRLALPLALVGLIVGLVTLLRTQGRRATALGFTLTWSFCFLVISIDQVRFVNFLAAPLAVGCGFALARCFASKVTILRGAGWIGIGALVAASGMHRFDHLLAAYHRFEAPTIEACRWMAQHTDDSGGYLDPENPPEYGVITHPALGHHVTYFGKRPATSNPFFDIDGIRRSADFLLAPDQDAAIAAMQAAHCRYAFISYRCMDITHYAPLLSDEATRARWEATASGSAEQANLLSVTPYVGLYLTEGNTADILLGEHEIAVEGAYDRFRLVYASNEAYRGHAAHAKIFELVEGARIEAKGRVGTTVELRVPVRFPDGYSFDFVRSTTLTRESRDFSLRSPYPTAARPATLSITDARGRVLSSHELTITEDDVRNGTSLTIDL